MSGARRIWFLLIVGVGGVAILLTLGVWQWQRLQWKEGLIAGLTARIEASPLTVTGGEIPDDADYRRAEAVGTFDADADPARYLTSLKPLGPGYRVIQPFTLTSGVRVLVDRGFIPDAVDVPPAPAEPLRLTGALRWPQEVSSFTPEPNLRQGRWFARDVPRLAEVYETRPVMLVLDTPPGDPIETPWPRPTPVSIALPNDHFGYAVTWFSLAAIWTIMTTLLVIRSGPRKPVASAP